MKLHAYRITGIQLPVLGILIFTISFLSSCENGHKKQKNSRAEQLNHQGMQLQMNVSDNKDSLTKSLLLIDSAIQIQPDFYVAYWNKLSVLQKLKKHQKYLATLERLEQVNLNPLELPYIKDLIGITMERQGMDSLKARKKFLEADHLYQTIMDTVTRRTKSYWLIQEQRAVNLTLLNKEKKKKQLITKLEKLAKKDNNQLQIRMLHTLSEQTRTDLLAKKDSL